MIAITNLNKFYTTRRKMHHALKDVCLELPDKGFVFVLGKSGSGKSTLLNLLGGLDRASSGKIVVNGNDVSAFSENELTDYRNSCIGFVFQDHHLIDDLTVYQNIKLALDLQQNRNTSLILQALERVGLEGYEERYPRELSGGERQRVAIARAIVKRPRVLLADEPTGNLDGKNAAEIMGILKELSKDCLVLTVSHNIGEVQTNADRILELSEGQIVGDMTRNPEYQENAVLQDNTIFVPGDRPISETDVAFINDSLSGQKVRRFAINANKFAPSGKLEPQEHKILIKKTSLNASQVLCLSLTFLKTKVWRIISAAIPLSLILLIIMLSQAYINFDGNRIIADRMKKAGQQSIVLNKEVSLDGVEKDARRYPAAVTQEDLQAFLGTGFEGKTYPVLSVSVPVTSYKNAAGFKSSGFSYGVAAAESLGTVCVDEQFFEERLGSFTCIVRVRQDDPLGVYITDYLADVILATNSNYKGMSYTNLLGKYAYNDNGVGDIYINGIIQTNYKDRYAALIDRVTVNKETDIAVLYNDEEFQRLSSELYSFLAYSYTFNPNYAEDYMAAGHTYAWSHKLGFNSKTYSISKGYVTLDSSLKDGQIMMGYKMYNAVFGASYNPGTLSSFQPHDAQMAQYTYYDTENKTPLFDTKVQIAGLYNGDGIRVSKDVLKQFIQNHIRQTGIYFDDLSHLADILDVAEARGFIQDSITLEGILTLSRSVMLFVMIFRLANTALCAAVIFVFVSFSTKMIRDKLHEIGILKALGTPASTINSIFGLQIGLIAALTCAASILGYYCLIGPANELFILSLRQMVPSQLVLDLEVLVFLPSVVAEIILLIVILSVLSMAVPLSRIGKIQPVQIINNRE